jgi:hypothetical protein
VEGSGLYTIAKLRRHFCTVTVENWNTSTQGRRRHVLDSKWACLLSFYNFWPWLLSLDTTVPYVWPWLQSVDTTVPYVSHWLLSVDTTVPYGWPWLLSVDTTVLYVSPWLLSVDTTVPYVWPWLLSVDTTVPYVWPWLLSVDTTALWIWLSSLEVSILFSPFSSLPSSFVILLSLPFWVYYDIINPL